MPDNTDPLTPSADGDELPASSPGGDDTRALSADELARAMEDGDAPTSAAPSTPGALGGPPGVAGAEITIDNAPSTRAQRRRQQASVKRRWVIALIALAVV